MVVFPQPLESPVSFQLSPTPLSTENPQRICQTLPIETRRIHKFTSPYYN